MNRSRGALVGLVSGAAFATSFLFAGAAVLVVQLALLDQSDPKLGGPWDNFALGMYLVVAGCLFAAPAFVLVTSSSSAWRCLAPNRALTLAAPAGVLAFLTHLTGVVPRLFSWLIPHTAGPVLVYGTYFCIAGLVTGLLVVLIVRGLMAPAAAS